jgi:hypothetical protein
MKRAERPFKSLPTNLLVGFLMILAIQVSVTQLSLSRNEHAYKTLSAPLAASAYRIVAMGSDHLMSYLLAMRLQLHDNQSAKHIRYENINYRTLVDWLNQISDLNVQSEYPTMLASRVYGQTGNEQKLRIMVDLIRENFIKNPQIHWRRMAEATILAKHKLGDLELALSLAEKLSSQPADLIMPHWARDMQFILLGELNEFEAGITIISALLESGVISDPDEKQFLKEKWLDFQKKLSEVKQQ